MQSRPNTMEAARDELARLRDERRRAGRFFWAFIPLGIGVPLIILGDNAGTAVMGLAFAVWGGGTALGFIPAANPPSRYYPDTNRIRYLEGYVAGHRDDETG